MAGFEVATEEGSLGPEDLQNLQIVLRDCQAKLARAEAEVAREITSLRAEQDPNELFIQAAKQELTVLQGREFSPHCETCRCSLAELRKKTDDQIREKQAGMAVAEARIKEMSGCLAAAERSQPAEIENLRETIAEIEHKIAQYQAAEAARKALAEAEPREAVERRLTGSLALLEEVRRSQSQLAERLERCSQCRSAIADYKRRLKEAEDYERAYLVVARAQIPKAERVIHELENLREAILNEGLGGLLQSMEDFLTPFGMKKIRCDVEKGFFVDGLPVEGLSRGQSSMFFEAAFRVAVARKTGFHLIVLDHDAPVDDTSRSHLANSLLQSLPFQLIQTWTLSQKPASHPIEHLRRYWLSRGPEGVAKVEPIDA